MTRYLKESDAINCISVDIIPGHPEIRQGKGYLWETGEASRVPSLPPSLSFSASVKSN